MRFILTSICCSFFYSCLGCSDQMQPIPSTHTSNAEQAQKELITLAKPSKEVRSETKTHLSPKSRELFAWFDTLGFPDLNNRMYLQVPLAWITGEFDDVEKTYYTNAFLLEHNQSDFKIFRLDLVAYSETDFNTITGLPHHVKEVNLKDAVIKRLKELREPEREAFSFGRFSKKASERVELFVLARGCFGNGLNQLAEELITETASIPDNQTGKPVDIADLKTVLSDEIADSMMWRHVLALGNPEVKRTDLLVRFRDFIVKFPHSQHTERAKVSAGILEKMIKEDEEHARKVKKPLAEMTTQERVAELIYQLRDQNGFQFSQPGDCNIFFDPRDGGLINDNNRGGGSPASKLVAIGDEALEQLIDSVDDDRFTRSVRYHRNFYFSHSVIRVGECCMTIIDKIQPTGRRFDIKGNSEQAKHAMKVWYLGD